MKAIILSHPYLKLVLVAMGMITFDVITGIIAAFSTGTFQSSQMRKGGWHKLTLVIAVVFGSFLNFVVGLVDLGITIPIGEGICIYIILMEICSNIENINKACPGVIPESIVNMFHTSKDEAEKITQKE